MSSTTRAAAGPETVSVPEADTSPPGSGWAVALGTCLLALWAGVYTDLGLFQSTDSLIPVFVSVDRWTPFFWGQDRYGMLLPLLALPFHDPGANLVAQMVLRAWAVLVVPFLVARVLLGRGAVWLLAGTLGVALLVWDSQLGGLSFYGYQPYAQAMTLALGGVLAWDVASSAARGLRRGLLAAFAAFLFLLSLWVSPSTFCWLLPLIVLRELRRLWHERGAPWPDLALLRDALRRTVPPIAMAVLATIAVMALARSVEVEERTALDLAPIVSWPRNWYHLLRAWFEMPWPLTVLASATPLLLPCAWRRGRRDLLALGSLATVIVGAAACEVALLGLLGWVEKSTSMTFRYALCGYLLVACCLPCLIASYGASRLGGGARRWAQAAAGGLVLAACFATWGKPDRARMEWSFDQVVRKELVQDLGRLRATHVLGDYWKVYPLAWRFNDLAYEPRRQERDQRRVFPLTSRSLSAQDLWRPDCWACARIAVLQGDGWRSMEAGGLGLPILEQIEDHPNFTIWRGRQTCGPCPSLPSANPRFLLEGRESLHQDGFESGDLRAWSTPD
jgi:hypothetical protein